MAWIVLNIRHQPITEELNMKLTNEIKRMLNALALANAGEYLSYRQKHLFLANTPAATVATPPAAAVRTKVQGRHQVALYLGSELSSDVMQYILQTCTRLRHDLTVLTLQTEEDARALLSPFMSQLTEAVIELRLITLSGDPHTALTHALRRHTDVAFLVCNESGYFGYGLLGNSKRNGSMPVPVVLIAAKDSAIAQATEMVLVAPTRAA